MSAAPYKALAKEFSMGGLSIWHILLFGAVALLLFGSRFKISDVMGDLGKGISSFRKGLANPDDHPEPPKKDTPAN